MTYLDDYQPGGPPKGAASQRPVFGKSSLSSLVGQGGIGFNPSTGFHIYCELRPTSKLEVAEDEHRALKYLRVIEDYVNYGVQAANPFGVTLLEAQGNVLHFYKDGDLNSDNIISAVQFAFLFTTALYDELKPELGDEWDGFATCMDHGDAVIVRHDSFTTSSMVSLGPAANAPAKQLLYGRTAAGCVEIPGPWARHLRQHCNSNWFSISLLNRSTLPLSEKIESAVLRRQLMEIFGAYHQKADRSRFSRVGTYDTRAILEGKAVDLSAPQRIQAFCIRADLDGFSATVRRAFEAGPEAVEKVAHGFASILEFGQHMERTTPGCIRLPWAGDCATILIPDTHSLSTPGFPPWLDFGIRWQNFDGGHQESKQRAWNKVFDQVQWAIGGCHGRVGMSLLADIDAQGRRFRIGAGWPVSMSLDAQNCGKGGDTVTHHVDHETLDAATGSLFERVAGSEFWMSKGITREKISHKAIEIGKRNTQKAVDYSAKYQSVQVPSPRPYYNDGQMG